MAAGEAGDLREPSVRPAGAFGFPDTGRHWRQPPAYLLSTAMSGNGNAAATAVSSEPVTLSTSVFRTSGATIGPKLPLSVAYWSGRLSVFFSFFFQPPLARIVFKGPVAGLPLKSVLP